MARIMPAALDVNWGEIKMLAQQVGVREAARRMGLNENAVMQRSAREGWIKDMPRSQPLPQTILRSVSTVSDAPKAAVNYLKEILVQTRTNHAKVALIASGELARVAETEPKALLAQETAQTLLTHAKHAALAGGWADQAPTPKVSLTVTGAMPVTIDVEAQEVETPEYDPLGGF